VLEAGNSHYSKVLIAGVLFERPHEVSKVGHLVATIVSLDLEDVCLESTSSRNYVVGRLAIAITRRSDFGFA
jgi:hypothetical protein